MPADPRIASRAPPRRREGGAGGVRGLTPGASRPLGLALATALLAALGTGCGGEGEVAAGSAPGPAPSAGPDAAPEGAAAAARWAARDWPTYGGDPGQSRHSRLTAIDTSNVRRLAAAWIHRTGVRGIYESSPIAVGGALYLTTPPAGGEQRVLKLDAATGDRVWEARVPLSTARPYPASVNRGVAVHSGRVYLGTLDARLVALDAQTGEVAWERRTADPAAGYQHKQAPLAWGGRVYMGVSGSPLGIRGFVKAFDAETGEELWTWHSIPSPDEGGWWGEWTGRAPGTDQPLGRDLAAERADSARHAEAWRRGGGAVWMTPTLDPDRGLVYVSVGNPTPELAGATRPGDNRWTVSVCALRVEDGSRRWCYQYLPHDVWGLDAASPPILFDLGGGDGAVPAVGHFSKLGVLYVWDRRSGELLTASESYVPRRNFLVPPRPAGTVMAPGIYGGTEWSPGAFDPATGWLYAANVHWPGRYVLRGGGVGFDLLPAGASRGNVVAVDPASGRVVWETRTPRPMVGGVLSTAGGLVFAGRLDGRLDAYHARTGERLWSAPVQHGCASAPVTYEAGGRQHVALTCGGHFLGGGRGDRVVAFALPPDTAPAGDTPP